jgi:hypothetical protein
VRGTKVEVKVEIATGPVARAATKAVDDNLILVVIDLCSFKLESRVSFSEEYVVNLRRYLCFDGISASADPTKCHKEVSSLDKGQ